MMLPVIQSSNGDGDANVNSGQLLKDIEEISKALYIQNTSRQASVSSYGVRPNMVEIMASKEKRSSSPVWSWKNPLKALSHIGCQKFDICFFLHVHSIEGLPPSFNDFNLSVSWKRKGEFLWTSPSTVSMGSAEFDETLMFECSVYGSRSGHHNSAKYETKLSLIYASVVGAPGVDLGTEWIDLTRLLPFTLEELECEKSNGKWITSFKLAGKARGATLNVSFGFSVVRDREIQSNMKGFEILNLNQNRMHRVEQKSSDNANPLHMERVSSNSNRRSRIPSLSLGLRVSDEVSTNPGLMKLSRSMDLLYKKLNEADLLGLEPVDASSEPSLIKQKPELDLQCDSISSEDYLDGIDFTVIEKGIEIPTKENFVFKVRDTEMADGSTTEIIDVHEYFGDNDLTVEEKNRSSFPGECKFDGYVDECKLDQGGSCEKKIVKEDYNEMKPNYRESKVLYKSESLDRMAETVASDFLNMLEVEYKQFDLGSVSDPNSPRAQLLREFESDIASGSFIMDFGSETPLRDCDYLSVKSESVNMSESDASLICWEKNHQMESQLLSRRNAKVLENLEAEALMKEWGLSEEDFLNSPSCCADGFGSPIELLQEKPVELPPLGDGFGPFLQTKDGGCLRSMSPTLFRNSKSIGPLIMQVSRPVVLPADMGSDAMEILQKFASVGIEKLSIHANKLMPLEDLTGKTLEQVVLDASSKAKNQDSQAPLHQHESSCGLPSFDRETYVNAEDLAPLMMEKIGSLVIEGLRIQSGLSDGAAPSIIPPKSNGRVPSFKVKEAVMNEFLNFEDDEELQLHSGIDKSSDADRLLGLSITLEEWLRLDSGIIVNEGMLENHLTLALRVLLRDPLRNYEAVGNPMLALVQVERIIRPPIVESWNNLLEQWNNKECDYETAKNREIDDEGKDEKNKCATSFKITEVFLSGFNVEPGNMHLWGTKAQQQYGTRWLHTSELYKPSKYPMPKSKAIVVSHFSLSKKMQTTDALWSIKSDFRGKEATWNESAGSIPYIRNPDIIFS